MSEILYLLAALLAIFLPLGTVACIALGLFERRRHGRKMPASRGYHADHPASSAKGS